MNERMKDLLIAAASCFEGLSDPFSHEWLSDHRVTLDECGDLSEAIAGAIRLYLYLPKDERLSYQLKQVIDEADMPVDVKRLMRASLDFRQALNRVKETKH